MAKKDHDWYSRKYISKEKFEALETEDKVKVSYMKGVAILQTNPDVESQCVMVLFKGGPWNGRELEIMRQQIVRVL